MAGPVEGGQDQSFAQAQAFGGARRNMPVDELGDLEPLRGGFEDGDHAVFERLHPERTGAPGQQAFEKGIGSAEIQHRHGTRLAVDAPALDDAPVGMPFGPDCL